MLLTQIHWYLNLYKNTKMVKQAQSPVLKEAQRLAHKGHLYFHRRAAFKSVSGWNQQHICHLLHHQPHVWYILMESRKQWNKEKTGGILALGENLTYIISEDKTIRS